MNTNHLPELKKFFSTFAFQLILLFAISIYCLCFGISYYDECPSEPNLPKSFFAFGLSSLIFSFLFLIFVSTRDMFDSDFEFLSSDHHYIPSNRWHGYIFMLSIMCYVICSCICDQFIMFGKSKIDVEIFFYEIFFLIQRLSTYFILNCTIPTVNHGFIYLFYLQLFSFCLS